MQYGFSIPNGGPLAGPEALRKIARLSAVKAKPTMIRVETFD